MVKDFALEADKLPMEKRRMEVQIGGKRQKLEKRLGLMLWRLADINNPAWSNGKEIEVWVREKGPTDDGGKDIDVHTVVRSLDFNEIDETHDGQPGDVEMIVTVDALADGQGDGPDCPGAVGDGEWLRVRDGMTVKSGSAVFVMPITCFHLCRSGHLWEQAWPEVHRSHRHRETEGRPEET